MKRFYKFVLACAICESALLITQKIDGTIQKEWWEVFIPVWCAIPLYFIVVGLINTVWNALTSKDIIEDVFLMAKVIYLPCRFILHFP